MKPSGNFNSPADVVARLGYLTKSVLILLGGVLAFEASLTRNAAGLLPGALSLAVAMLIHALLVRSGRLESCRNSLDNFGEDEPPLPEGEDSVYFAALLQQRTEIEARRGTPEFDPWDLSTVRHQISAYLGAHPDFATRFRRYEAEHQG